MYQVQLELKEASFQLQEYRYLDASFVFAVLFINSALCLYHT